MTHAAVLALSLAGFALLLAAMARHRRTWLRRDVSPRAARALRLSGFLSLAAALAVAGMGLGWAYGAVAWCGWLTVAAFAAVAATTARAAAHAAATHEGSARP